MKNILICLALLVLQLNASAQARDFVLIKIENAEFTLEVGGTIELGYGKNPYGSFMYIHEASSSDTPLSKELGGKLGEIKKIQAFPKQNYYLVRFKSRYDWGAFKIAYDTNRCQAVEIGEILKINGLATDLPKEDKQ